VQPETRYARNGDVAIAHQIAGEGPFDFVLVAGSVSNCELNGTRSCFETIFPRLAEFTPLILFDKRGTHKPKSVPGARRLYAVEQ
jgi:hypothetical protein